MTQAMKGKVYDAVKERGYDPDVICALVDLFATRKIYKFRYRPGTDYKYDFQVPNGKHVCDLKVI